MTLSVGGRDFVYMKLSPKRFIPCNSLIGLIDKIEVKHCHLDSEIVLSKENFAPTTVSASWLPFVRVALQDPRVVDYFELRRVASPPKFLKLPFIRQFSISEGIKVYYV